jgi:hypothetical protein
VAALLKLKGRVWAAHGERRALDASVINMGIQIPIEIAVGVITFVVAMVGLAVRTWVKSKIEHRFKIEIENLKANHAREIESAEANSSKELEKLRARFLEELEQRKAEIALRAKQETSKLEMKSKYFPLLVVYLRKMKHELENAS